MSARSAALLLLLAAGACRGQDVVALIPGGADAGPLDAAESSDAASADAGFCAGSGPVVVAGDSAGGAICGGTVAEQSFRFALCTCDDFTSSEMLSIDAWDSRRGPYQTGPGQISGGSLGANGRVAPGAPMQIGGSLWIGSPLGFVASRGSDLTVAGAVQSAGPIASDATVAVGLDAFAGGDVRAASLSVGGTLVLPAGAAIDVAGAEQLGGTRRAAVTVAPPCGCAASARLDVAGLVARHASDNDNDAIGLDPAWLANHQQAAQLVLPCGRFYLTAIGGHGPLTITVRGRAALFIENDVALDDTLSIAPAGGELDLFIAGTLVSSALLQLGSSTEPAKVRVYVGGAGTIQLSGGAFLGGNLYAPSSELVTSAPLEAFGSIFVRRVSASDAVRIHFDQAVLSAADDCPPPPSNVCSTCLDCHNNACTGGVCGACRADADCCAPLFCKNGACSSQF
jgi:hypothetical protein